MDAVSATRGTLLPDNARSRSSQRTERHPAELGTSIGKCSKVIST
ncbi:hypothetical protein [Lentzea waywayandensis]|nr:hypothetical protein [Lentzea waywayandensis]